MEIQISSMWDLKNASKLQHGCMTNDRKHLNTLFYSSIEQIHLNTREN